MNRKLILLNVALLALLGSLAWLIRERWREERARELSVLQQIAPIRQVLPPPSRPGSKPLTANDYIVVAQNMLFSKDRNSTVAIDPPPPPKPEPPMPALPAYHGIMAMFGDPVVFFSLGNGGQKKYHAGDSVGPFKIVSFDKEKLVFEWNGKIVERKPEELLAKVEAPPAVQSNQIPNQNQAPQPTASPNVIMPSSAAAPVDPKLGKDAGGVRTCVPGDASPPGTILDGYKKVVTRTMFGETCRWEPAN